MVEFLKIAYMNEVSLSPATARMNSIRVINMNYRKTSFSQIILSILLFIGIVNSGFAATLSDQAFKQALQTLNEKSFSKKIQAIEKFSIIEHPKTRFVLQSLLDGNLFYRKADKQVFFAEKKDSEYLLKDVVSLQIIATVGKRKAKKIRINNKIRKLLRLKISAMSLHHADPKVRHQAVKEMMKEVSADTANILRQKLATEKDATVSSRMRVAIALFDLTSEDKNLKITALKTLSESASTETKYAVIRILEKNAQGSYIEQDQEIIQHAVQALDGIETQLKFYGFIETLFFGLSLGSVLLLAAIGLAITFGVMGVINMAHGELIMLGAYTTYVIQLFMPNNIEYSIFVAIPAAFIVAGTVGIMIERGILRFLYGRPLETLLATFGVSLVLQQLVRSVFSPLNRSVETPEWMSGAWEINSALSITFNRLYILIFCILVFLILLMILKKTSLGLHIRAVSQNRQMAKAMGVRSEWVDAMTFGLGSGIAGVAGVALSQLSNVGPNMGQAYIIDSFLVVVFGGVGNLWGTFVGAMSLGVANKFLEPWSGAVLAKIFILVFIILFIQKKPRGLFPQKGRSAEN